MTMTTRAPVAYDPGPLLVDPELPRWLERLPDDGGRLRIRLPISIGFSADGPRAVASAALFVPANGPTVSLALDDSALGVGLMDRLEQLCPEGERCLLWLEGYMGALLGDPAPGEPLTLAILAVGDRLTAEEAGSERLRVGTSRR